MSVITTIETEGRAALTAVEHAALWLVDIVSTTETSLDTIEKDSPLVAQAIAAGEAAAAARGVPIAAIENIGEEVLSTAKALAARPTAPVVATASGAQPIATIAPAA